MKNDLSLYVHWPFCLSKCPYCDFNSHVADTIDFDQWTTAYTKALNHYEFETKGQALISVFFGGGTPSLMPPEIVGTILEQSAKLWAFADDIEITLEANPTSVEIQKFQTLKSAGINRLSLGVQSLRPDVLRFLGREHSVDQAKAAITSAAETFERYSFDLIYARPDQTMDDWRDELSEALELAGEHLSLYQLTIEKSTAFHRDGVSALEPDAAAIIFSETRNILKSKGLPAYEVSNHAAPGAESRHNLQYWQGGDYIGVGPGAHGRLRHSEGRIALVDHRDPTRWLETAHSKGSGLHQRRTISVGDWMVEDLMMGLRLNSGLSRSEFLARHGCDVLTALNKSELDHCIEAGLIQLTMDTLAISDHAMVNLDAILARIISDQLV